MVIDVNTYFRAQRIAHEGQFITGRVTEASGSTSKNTYTVSIHYAFTTPDGEELSRKESRTRNDLRRMALPSAGTPVVVVYVNPKLYRML